MGGSFFSSVSFGLRAEEGDYRPKLEGLNRLHSSAFFVNTHILANMDARVGWELLPLATDLLVTRPLPLPLLPAAATALEADVEPDCVFDFLEAVDCKRKAATVISPFPYTLNLKPDSTAIWESK